MKNLPYTKMIKDEIIRDLEKLDIRLPNIPMNAEFEAGARTMKEFIIKSLKK